MFTQSLAGASVERFVADGLARARQVLDRYRADTLLPADAVAHTYTDKFRLANLGTNTAIACIVNALAAIDQNKDKRAFASTVNQIANAVQRQGKTATLRLTASNTCSFLREHVYEVSSSTQHITESSLMGTISAKSVTTVREYFYRYDAQYELAFLVGNDKLPSMASAQRSTEIKVMHTKASPVSESRVADPVDFDLTWLFQNIDPSLSGTFAIDRSKASCRTPRRNDDVQEALDFFEKFLGRLDKALSLFDLHYAKVCNLTNKTFQMSDFYKAHSAVFIPVLPFLNSNPTTAGASTASSNFDFASVKDLALPADDDSKEVFVPPSDVVNSLLEEYMKSLEELRNRVAGEYKYHSLVNQDDVFVWLSLVVVSSIGDRYSRVVHYIEDMILKQLVSAIGKSVSPRDFQAYMDFHYRKFLKPEFAPKTFCYAIRRTMHSVEGILSVEYRYPGDVLTCPVQTICNSSFKEYQPIQFLVNGTDKALVFAEKHLHVLFMHQFQDTSALQFSLNARAKQFSGFILLAGNLVTSNLFSPKCGLIIQNNDDLSIPLKMDRIPSAKEFRDAIESLSPEQQRFAKAYRSLQLESTIFVVCVLQIKPQLERLLNLPEDSLIKEISLSQDLMDLFIKYQIPADLLSFNGDLNASKNEKVAFVKGQVESMNKMIKDAQDVLLEEKKREEAFKNPPLPRPNVRASAMMKAVPQPRIQNDLEVTRNIMVKNIDAMIARGDKLDSLADRSESLSKNASAFMAKKGGGLLSSLRNAMPSFSSSSGPRAENESYRPSRGDEFHVQASYNVPAASALSAPAPAPVSNTVLAAMDTSAPSQPAQPQISTPEQTQVSQTSPTADQIPNESKSPEPHDSLKDSQKASSSLDFLSAPSVIEGKLVAVGMDQNIRPTTIALGDGWSKKSQASLLSDPLRTTLDAASQKIEKDRALDLVDALSRSGALPFRDASFHVVVGLTHCFDKTLMNTLVQDNVNPIEEVQNAMLNIASVIHSATPQEMLKLT